jgi:hypothetical protein
LGDEFASEGFGEEDGREPMVSDRPKVIDVLTGFLVLGFDSIGLFELWDG